MAARQPSAALLAPLAAGHYDGLALEVQRGRGERPGDRRFPGRAETSGVEVEAHRPYAAGDDLRHLDWNAVGRLDALLVRRFTAEREVVFHLLLDTSASMTVPAPEGKLALARELGLVLVYLALASNDAVRIVLLGGDGAPRESPVLRGGRRGDAIVRAADFIADAPASGTVALGRTLAAYAARRPHPGVVLVVSDFMSEPDEIELGVRTLAAARHEIALLHVIGAAELDPTREFQRGIVQDVESGDRHPVSLGPATLDAYRRVLAGHLDALAALATRWQATYARVATDETVRDFATGRLAALGLVRRR
jgi:uncharacterized protein (DUF58 family)